MSVAIVGAGISGVTLALRLQQLGVSCALYTERSPGEQRRGRLENMVARFAPTQTHERELGVAHWDTVEGYAGHGLDLDVVGADLHFSGRLTTPARAVDFRLYLSTLVEDFSDRKGSLHVGPLPEDADELVELTRRHDVVVVAAGRSARVGAAIFPVREDRSPHRAPQRRLCGGLFTGVTPNDPNTISFNLIPGAGEIFQQAILTEHGVRAAILVEAVPGGPLDRFTKIDVAGDPASFSAVLVGLVNEWAPSLARRIDPSRFASTGPLDIVTGAITPTVRHGWAQLPDGRLALAIGDAWVVNDPVTGQGANIGSHCAWTMASALATAPTIDADFAATLEDELWAFAGPVTAWTNSFLLPPPPHIGKLLATAASHQALADAFAQGFADPVRLAGALASEEMTDAFIDRVLSSAWQGRSPSSTARTFAEEARG